MSNSFLELGIYFWTVLLFYFRDLTITLNFASVSLTISKPLTLKSCRFCRHRPVCFFIRFHSCLSFSLVSYRQSSCGQRLRKKTKYQNTPRQTIWIFVDFLCFTDHTVETPQYCWAMKDISSDVSYDLTPAICIQNKNLKFHICKCTTRNTITGKNCSIMFVHTNGHK